MDYSQLSNDDLVALKSKNYSKMSNDGLMFVKQLNAAQQKAQQQVGPQPGQPAENQDKQKLQSGVIDNSMQSHIPPESLQPKKSMLRQAADMATSGAMGLGEGAALGYGRKPEDWEQEAINEHPTSNSIGKGIGSLLPNMLTGAMASGATAGMGGIARILGSAGAFGAKGALENPQQGETRAQNAGIGALVGGGGQAASEALQAGPSALKAAYRSVIPEKASTYFDRLGNLAGQGNGEALESYVNAANPLDKVAAKDTLTQLNPQIAEEIGQKSSQMSGMGARDAVASKASYGMMGGLAGALSGHPSGLGVAGASMAAAPLAGAAVGGGKEALRQLAKPASSVNDPQNISLLMSIADALKK